MLMERDKVEQQGFWPGTFIDADLGVPVRGTVYGIVLYGSDADRHFAAEEKSALPSAPVLFIKPRNTYLRSGGIVQLPSTLPELEVSATVGLVFGANVRNVTATKAFDAVAGLLLALDLSEPGAGLFRPPIREKCRDGFLPLGSSIVAADRVSDLAGLSVSLQVDGHTAASLHLADNLAAIASSIEAISTFMTLRAGDVLLAARTTTPVRARAGSRVAAISQALGRVECSLAFEEEVLA